MTPFQPTGATRTQLSGGTWRVRNGTGALQAGEPWMSTGSLREKVSKSWKLSFDSSPSAREVGGTGLFHTARIATGSAFLSLSHLNGTRVSRLEAAAALEARPTEEGCSRLFTGWFLITVIRADMMITGSAVRLSQQKRAFFIDIDTRGSGGAQAAPAAAGGQRERPGNCLQLVRGT